MNYDDMPAGPELDRLVAEKVMGWTPALAANGKDIGLFNTGRPNIGNDDHQRWLSSFTPSTNIAHAWEVVEKMKAQHRDVTILSRYRIEPSIVDDEGRIIGTKWCVNISAEGRGLGYGGGVDGTDLSLPLAICRASLKATEANHGR